MSSLRSTLVENTDRILSGNMARIEYIFALGTSAPAFVVSELHYEASLFLGLVQTSLIVKNTFFLRVSHKLVAFYFILAYR